VKLSFVLVGTTHAGNIGAAARAIKTMGFTDLRLVDTCKHRTAEALARASGANDVLESAPRFASLDEALADVHISYGTTARDRHLAVPIVTAREAAEQMMLSERRAAAQTADGATDLAANAADYQFAVVFGRERSGLTNDELDRCNRLLRIPCNPEFSSLNLGSAVQVIAYEAAQAQASAKTPGLCHEVADHMPKMATVGATVSSADAAVATGEAMQNLFAHLERIMLHTGFLDPENPRHLMRRVRQYFERTRPTDVEMNILRGFLTSIEKPKRRG